MNDLVTVVTVATWSYREMLREAIDSVRAQTVPTRHVLVLYGDPDLWYHELMARHHDPRCSPISVPEDPFILSSARNIGIGYVTTPYVICLDADDQLAPTFVERHLELAAPDTFVTCGFRVMGQTEHHLSPLFTDFSVSSFLDGNKAIVSTMFPKSAWEALGGFMGWRGGNYFDDWSMWLRASNAGYQWRLLPEHLLLYRENIAGLSAQARRQGLIAECLRDLRAEFGGEAGTESA